MILHHEASYYTPPDILGRAIETPVLKPLLLTWTGCYIKAEGHRVTDRSLPDYVLIYCVEGQGWLRLGSREWTIRAGDVFVCPPGKPHSYGADKESPWTKYWIHCRGEAAGGYMDMLGLTETAPVMTVGHSIRMIGWLQDILKALSTGYTQTNLMMATAHTSNVLSYLAHTRTNAGAMRDSGVNAEALIGYMLDHLESALTLEQLSSRASMSKYHFIRTFKEQTGYTPMDYFTRLKVQKACELLEISSLSVSRIGARLGFASPYYFSIVFKRVIGRSPRHYREMVARGGRVEAGGEDA